MGRAVDELPDGTTPAKRDRLAMRASFVTVTREGWQAVDKLCDLHGASGFAVTSALQRYWRDLAVGSRHTALNGFISQEDYARTLAYGEPLVSTMVWNRPASRPSVA